MMLCSVVSCEKRGDGNERGKTIKVITSLFPVYDFAKNIGKDRAEVILLIPPGVEPHSFELKPADILKINQADIFVYTIGTMEPWVEDIVEAVDGEKPLIVEAGKGIAMIRKKGESGEIDPHIWLDFSNAQKLVDNILEGYLRVDFSNSSDYIKNAMEYKAKLAELDRKYKETLSLCKKDTIIHGGHFAFGYLAERYNLEYFSAYKGFSPDAEPSPGSLIKLIERMKRHELKYVFFEELITPRLAEAIAREANVKLLRLHGAHNITKDELVYGETFISLMEKNLANLKIGLECK